MMRSEQGFSLLEILIAIAVLGIVMAMSGQLLEHMVVGQKKQAVITINQFEASLGLEMLRNDVSNAGFGLADEFKGAPSIYREASEISNPDNPGAMQFNNTPEVPKAIQHANTISVLGYIQNSDYLVIRSPAVGMDSAAGKWSNITSTKVHFWNDINLDMATDDYMIVIKPRTQPGGNSTLIVSNGAYALKYPGRDSDMDENFRPKTAEGERFLVFGMGKTEPTMPFNRADYYVRIPDEVNPNCAPGTGVLYKDVIGDKDKNGDPIRPYPLVDCVVNMQVVFRLDTNADGIPDQTVNDIDRPELDAYKIKEQIKEVHIYILAHEGIKDKSYRSKIDNPVTVGPSASLGTVVDLSALDDGSSTDPDAWKQYRWITYKIVVKPKSFY